MDGYNNPLSYARKRDVKQREPKLTISDLLKTDAKYLTAEEIRIVKGVLRERGQQLRTCIYNLKKKYQNVPLDLQAIASGSRSVNATEGKICSYLSVIRQDDKRWIKRSEWTKTQVENYKQQYLKAIASRLCVSNPDIAFITGEKRVQDIADSLKSVFETEWEELYTATRKMHIHVERVSDAELYICLKDVFEYCYKCCVDMHTRQVEEFCRLLHMTRVETAAVGLLLHMKQLQLRTVSVALPCLQKVIRQEVVSQPLLATVVRSWRATKPPLRTYLDKCTEICWYMLIQEPSIALQFSANDDSMFRPFLEHGNAIEYVIWPAVLLNVGGSVIKKGLAQFKDIGTPDTELEFNLVDEVDEKGSIIDNNYYYHIIPKNYYYFTKDPE